MLHFFVYSMSKTICFFTLQPSSLDQIRLWWIKVKPKFPQNIHDMFCDVQFNPQEEKSVGGGEIT